MYNFDIVNIDTDSIMFCKPDQSPFSKEEQERLLVEINKLSPEGLSWSDDGYFSCVIVLKAKNYVLYDGKNIKYKGSALKSATLEIALKDFLKEIIDSIIFNKNNYKEIYHKYVKEINNIQDIKRWSSKKTISEKTLQSERTNELRIRQAIEGSEYGEGDKIWVYFTPDGNLKLAENFNNDYDKVKLLKKLHNTAKRFAPVMDINEYFVNYSLKKNQSMVDSL